MFIYSQKPLGSLPKMFPVRTNAIKSQRQILHKISKLCERH